MQVVVVATEVGRWEFASNDSKLLFPPQPEEARSKLAD